MRLSAARFCSICCLLASVTALSSCQRSGETQLFRTTGELFIDGQPAVGARLAFRPEGDESTARWPSGYPRAVVDDAGKFVVETFEQADGCPAGDYTVLVTWPATLPGGEHDEEAETVDRLRGRYATRESSPLKAKVEAKPTELGRYELK